VPWDKKIIEEDRNSAQGTSTYVTDRRSVFPTYKKALDNAASLEMS